LLVLWDSQTPHRFAGYIQEILWVEGYNWFHTHDLAADGPPALAQLAAHSVVITAGVALGEDIQQTLLSYVRGGGQIVALRPPETLAAALGLVPVQRDMVSRYWSLNPLCALNTGVELPPLQFHGRATLYTWPGESSHVLAYLHGEAGIPTGHPAISIGSLGQGQWAVFAYDLAESTVLFHQGRREQASTGPYADADGDRMYKPNDLFVGVLDPALAPLPQADLHQDALVRVLEWMASLRAPLPRVWHFPHGARAAAFINGDGDSMDSADLENTVATCERYGTPYTAYLMMEDHPKVSPEWEGRLRARGHDFGQHAWAGPRPTLEEMRAGLRREFTAFRERYGHDGVTYRGHSVIWVGWVEMARYLRENGVRLDTNFSAGRHHRRGYVNGSGLPVRFVDEEGTQLDIYEQATNSTDDGWMTDKLFVPAMTVDQCIAASKEQADAAIDRYHTVYQPYFHPLSTRPGPRSTQRWLEAVLGHCRERGHAFVNGNGWVAFNDARRALRLVDYAYHPHDGAATFTLEAALPATGLTLAFPAVRRGHALTTASVDDEPVAVRPLVLEGRAQVLLPADYAAGQRRRWRLRWASGAAPQ
jgi:hypothetical protein